MFFFNDPDYNIMTISNLSCLTVPEDQKEERRVVNGEVFKFKYPEVVADHYRYIGEVENHNALRNY